MTVRQELRAAILRACDRAVVAPELALPDGVALPWRPSAAQILRPAAVAGLGQCSHGHRLFLVAALIVPLARIIHPVWYDAGRIFPPAWVSMNLGIALLLTTALITQRDRILRAADHATPSRPGTHTHRREL